MRSRLLLEPVPASGSWNMALDETLLESAIERALCTVRLYQWSEPTVSLGYFQHASAIKQNSAYAGLSVVRRLSGGGAILHDHELTYSVCLPAVHPQASQPGALYRVVHEALIRVLAGHDIPARMRGAPHHDTTRQPDRPAGMPTPSTNSDAFLCFGRGDPNDVVLGAHKIIGSAQRRRRGAILQHGSILLERSPYAPEFPGIHDLTGVRLSLPRLAEQIGPAILEALGMSADIDGLTEAEREHARTLEAGRYRSAE